MGGVTFSEMKSLLLLLMFPWQTVVFSIAAMPSSSPELPHCETLKSEISKTQEAVKVRKNFNGLWVSPRCEIQPGPKFVVRRYHFYRDMTFRIVRFYFNDPWCCSPAYSVTAVGRFEPLFGHWASSSGASSSWIVPGALEMDFVLSRIVLVPFSSEKATFLSAKVNDSCPGFVRKPWRLHRKYLVLSLDYPISSLQVQASNTADEFDCTGQLDLTFHELQLLRVEQRPATSFLRRQFVGQKQTTTYYDVERRRKNHRVNAAEDHRLELYLGAEIPGKHLLRPTSYQSPLLSPKEPGCETCQLIEKASRTSPPRLCSVVLENQRRFELEGDWISQRCEVKPQGFFLRQHFTFKSFSNEWIGEHIYFLDPNCKSKVFKLRAQGHFYKGPLSKVVPGARDVDFKIEQATLTPLDVQFIDNLNALDRNGSCSLNQKKWARGLPVNLTATRGCEALGVFVPSVELDLVKLEKHGRQGETMLLLYLGQAAGNEGDRPTSFQPPLLNCRSEAGSKASDKNLDNFLRPMAQIQLQQSTAANFYSEDRTLSGIVLLVVSYIFGNMFYH